MLDTSGAFVKYFPCDLRGDIKYPYNIGIEDCQKFCEEVLYKSFKSMNAYPLNLVTILNDSPSEFSKEYIGNLKFTYEIINNHPEDYYISIKIQNEEEFLRIVPFINWLASIESLNILSTSKSEFYIEEGVPKFWSNSENKVVSTMKAESTFISFVNAGLVVLVGTNCSVLATNLNEIDD
ncbi:hypothetical protein FQ087_00815 [Sporosarcina sp. ANT_H38]|uniref:hypothetical protein n=1 Tax=Sporosarcina sp. ANT_H38 TaxID=2597358 RepID=UPI0011F2FCDF|nr:hypothetical protein [Sporosarcina sp. ANT_H38]KAA0964905.1 hypothetical protein FQ087_00815 [Sporosarcina sp. ANT_H38]